jgi:hypothetical protein
VFLNISIHLSYRCDITWPLLDLASSPTSTTSCSTMDDWALSNPSSNQFVTSTPRLSLHSPSAIPNFSRMASSASSSHAHPNYRSRLSPQPSEQSLSPMNPFLSHSSHSSNHSRDISRYSNTSMSAGASSSRPSASGFPDLDWVCIHAPAYSRVMFGLSALAFWPSFVEYVYRRSYA